MFSQFVANANVCLVSLAIQRIEMVVKWNVAVNALHRPNARNRRNANELMRRARVPVVHHAKMSTVAHKRFASAIITSQNANVRRVRMTAIHIT